MSLCCTVYDLNYPNFLLWKKWCVIIHKNRIRPDEPINITEKWTYLLLSGAEEEIKSEALIYYKLKISTKTKILRMWLRQRAAIQLILIQCKVFTWHSDLKSLLLEQKIFFLVNTEKFLLQELPTPERPIWGKSLLTEKSTYSGSLREQDRVF